MTDMLLRCSHHQLLLFATRGVRRSGWLGFNLVEAATCYPPLYCSWELSALNRAAVVYALLYSSRVVLVASYVADKALTPATSLL